MKSDDNWFKNKRYGIGWTPGSKKGWLLLLIYLLIVIGFAVVMLKDIPKNTFTKEVMYFLAAVFIATAGFIWLGSKKSPKSSWRWGKKDTDNPKDDL